MQIKKTFPLETLPLEQANAIYSALNTNVQSGLLLGPATAGSVPNTNWYQIMVTLMGGRRWMRGVNNLNCFTIAVSQLGLAFTGKVVFGFRFMTNTITASRTGALMNSSGGAIFDTIADGSNNNPLLQGNTEHYIEAVLDFADSTYRRYVDGKLQNNTIYTLNSTQIANIKAGHVWIGAYTGASDNWWARDVHVREYAPGETYVPFADVTVEPVGITAVANSDWASSDGSNIGNALWYPMNDLTINPNLGSTVSPFVEGSKGSAASPLALTLGSFSGTDGTILGMELLSTMKSMDAAPAAVTPKLTQGGIDQAFAKQTLGGAYFWRRSTALINTASDGSALTRANIQGASLVLTPSAS